MLSTALLLTKMQSSTPQLFILLLCLNILKNCAGKQILADVTSNKLTRQNDGSFGLWSFQGTAKESHASKTSFIYNADLLSPDGRHHVDIASTVYPSLGLTSDLDPIYQEYLILQAKAVGIDGFMIEWGYMNHSSDKALRTYITLAQRHSPFKLAVNWCGDWLIMKMKNKSSQEVIDAFHSNLQYLMDMLYSSPSALYRHDNPVIFWFSQGLTLPLFRALLSMPLSLPPGTKPPLWIGSYSYFAASQESYDGWSNLLNGTFGWAPNGTRLTPANMSEWDFYDTVDDVINYQKNVSRISESCVSSGQCVLWGASASPGFDNRGCAGWGHKLRYVPRLDTNNLSRSTYEAQWQYHISSNTSAEYIIIPTMNDFPEATPILDLTSLPSSLYSTLRYTSQWKGYDYDTRGLILPPIWYQLYKEMQFYNMTPGIDVQPLEDLLDAANLAISEGSRASLSKAWLLLQNAKDFLNSNVKAKIIEEDIVLSVPSTTVRFSIPPIIQNGSYVINKTSQIYLHMDERTASKLRNNNFKGLLSFQYQPLAPGFSYMRVISSSKARTSHPHRIYTFYSKGLVKESKVESNRSEVCKIHVDGTEKGTWQNATVTMYKENQSWDHLQSHGSDLVFSTVGSFAVRNVSLRFTIFSKR